MALLIATDIFGETAWTQEINQQWQDQGQHCLVVSPYEQRCNFADEQSAYLAFTKAGGLDAYRSKLEAQLLNLDRTEPICFVGFSAGAAALWCELTKHKEVTKLLHRDSFMVCFYPGQIRHHLALEPGLSCHIVLVKEEQHFDLSTIIEYLVTKPKTKVIQNSWLHGYANPNSKNWLPSAADAVQKLLSHKANLVSADRCLSGLLGLEAHNPLN